MTGTLVELDPTFARALIERKDKLDVALVERAYQFSAAAHRGQKRRSGDDFVSHSVAVARILVDQQLDSVTVAAALLHDVVEDADITVDEMREVFGDDVAGIVDGLTKISSLRFHSTAEEQVENYRKLLLSIARDARVIIVKLADRLHNMRTLEHLPDESQHRIALETREIYAPLAHRFGMAGIKAELEDLAFKFLEGKDYKGLAGQVQAKRGEREEMIARLKAPLEEALRRAGIAEFEVTGRPKHLWSIYKKMRQREKPFDEIFDLMAVRVLVQTVRDCYHALGVVHHHWTPLQERIKDYIASPKSNGYQSLHTTIFGPGGQLYEIQIRSREMHRTAEYGIAAHWTYKESRSQGDDFDRHFAWFRQLLELQQDTHTPEEFLEFLKIDLYQDEIFVFTPKGDVKRLPKGATAIDFAFAVHTEVGLRCQGAKINSRIAPLHRALRNGDTVAILTGTAPRPSRDWLNHVRTARARHKIRQWIRQEESETSVTLGRDILGRELRRRRLSAPEPPQLQAAALALGAGSADGLYQALGRGDTAIGQVIAALFPDRSPEDLQAAKPTALGRVMDRLWRRGVRIQGVDGLLVRYAQCCQPVPGDTVIGYVTRGRGIAIHRADCPNLLSISSDPDRRVEIDWKEMAGQVFVVGLGVLGEDRRGLYADLMQAISATGTNIKNAELASQDGGMSGLVIVEVENTGHLAKVMRAMRKVKGVTGVRRRDPAARPPLD
ncbi:MAG TPA: bifunctional (p)ppGpp synthetase/guanosine-3',5'-bis(diphosphate) 3'-pyrophosphohydrolase [Gemmatimonadales bacterium]